MYRADAARSGHTSEKLPATLQVSWKHRMPKPEPAWPSSGRITCDFAQQPVVANGVVVVGLSAEPSVVALDAADGRVRWSFPVGGPVRFAPVVWRDRVFAASDDGYLYALALPDGRLLWKHRGGPEDRMCVGNERMISRWPARGGPVMVDGTIYYSAGIWPSDGVYVHALEAESGNVVWTNGDSGGLVMPQPHGGAVAKSGVAPQGYLLANRDRLFVPTGRAVPAGFRRSDGKFEHYLLQENGSIGGARALISERYLINGGCFLECETGKLAARAGQGVFGVTPEGVVQFTGTHLTTYAWREVEEPDRKGQVVRYRGLSREVQVELSPVAEDVRLAAGVVESLPSLGNLFHSGIRFKDADAGVAGQTGLERVLAQNRPEVEQLGGDVKPFLATTYERSNELITAGDEAICGSHDLVRIVNLREGRLRWSHPVEGDAVGLAVAAGRLFVATTTGMLYCFGEAAPSSAPPDASGGGNAAAAPSDPAMAELARDILQKSGIRSGFCLDIDCGEGRLARELARQSDLQIVGLEEDAGVVERARRQLTREGLHGRRITVLQGKPRDGLLPRYFADLIVSSAQIDNPGGVQMDTRAVESLQRPDGGVICRVQDGTMMAQRRGSLEGGGRWTHQNSDAANTLCSEDVLVKGPLEASWYRDGVLEIPDRHAQGPAPLFNRGVLVVEGVHGICGIDAYNGRQRWVQRMEGILADWDGVHHDVGVGDCGSNFCLGDDAVFVRTGPRCVKFDLFQGAKLAEFSTPVSEGATDRNWGFIASANGLIYGSVLNEAHRVSPRYANIRLRTESVLLFALDAATGELRWKYKPEGSLRNNAIAIAGERLYLIDRPLVPADRIDHPKPNGKHRPLLKPEEMPPGALLALDARTGTVVWKSSDDIFGTQLAVSGGRNVLLMYYQGVKHNFFKLPSEIGGRMAAFQTQSGERIWDRKADYKTRPIINGDLIYSEGGAWELGSGAEVPWQFQRSYGCGQIAASRHLLLFRSATLGYLDLSREAGVENFGGIRSSCWFNAIPAGGLVLVPDGAAKCACSYQTNAWLALQPRG